MSLIKLPIPISSHYVAAAAALPACSHRPLEKTRTHVPRFDFDAYHLPLSAFHLTLEHLLSSSADPPPPPEERSRRRRRRSPVRVAYQGPRGSYCQEAAAFAFPSLPVDALPCPGGLEAAFSAVELRHADLAVVPVENSLDGPIPRNLDLLLRHPSIAIVGEVVLPVNHCLLSLPGSLPSQIRRVVGHPQAISHCQLHLAAMGAVEVDEVSSGADAARHLAESGAAGTAVIGSGIAAKEFGLTVLRRNLQDDDYNYTRFLQLGLSPDGGGGGGKTAVAFALERGPSDLFRAMWAFESRGVVVKRVEHRPNRARPLRVEERANGLVTGYMDYVFVLEVEGAQSDPRVGAAIRQLGEVAEGHVRVLGSYGTC